MDQIILSLVGPVAANDLQYVDCYVGKNLGIFIPSVGHCGYALRQDHTHPAYSFVLFPDPTMDFLFDSQHLPGPDEYLVTSLSPGIPHQEPEGEEFVSYLAIMVGAGLCSRLAAGMTIPHCGDWQPFFLPKSAMTLIQAFMAETQTGGNAILLDALETAVAATLMQHLTGSAVDTGKTVSPHTFGIRGAIDWMQQHYAQRLTVEELSKQAGMSPGSFSRSFHRETGSSPMQYLIRLRLEKARKLLSDSDVSVTDTALRCGFHSPSHLAACFKSHYGVTPSAFRLGRNLQY